LSWRALTAIGSWDYADHRDAVVPVVDAVDDSIGAPAGTVPVVQRWLKPLADSVGVVEERPDDELVGREGDRLGQMLGEVASC
jgi:hypothetical protein